VTEFNYLVVGGGTAGCIVAARLAEDPSVSVGLVEWGPSDEHEPRARSIRRWAEMLDGEYDLDYRSVPQERGNSGIRQARLRILGGCSATARRRTPGPRPPSATCTRPSATAPTCTCCCGRGCCG
jgi:choline dehydrogenase-like flavoprotein